MDKFCLCQDFPFEYSKIDEKPCEKVRKILIDFGKVAVCGEYVKHCTIDNLNNQDVLSYRIKRDPQVDPLYQVFNLKKYEGFIEPGACLKLKILYKPVIPYEINIDTFEFVDSSFNIIKIRTVGESIGPRLSISVKKLDFYITPTKRITKRTFEIKNLTVVPAQFIFDCDKEQGIFQVVPKKGTIKGERHIYVEVNFLPKEPGPYSYQLHCITWCDVTFSHTIAKKQGIRGARPWADLVGEDYSTHDHAYKIVPDFMYIPPKNSVLIECHFAPPEMHVFYCKILIAQVYWTSHHQPLHHTDLMHYKPFTANLRVQGHSFPEEEYWIANIEIIPSLVTLPPCLPGHISNTNFKIHAIGHLPIMYRLVPPKKTNMIMKPMAGIIHSFAIIVVQLSTEKQEKTTIYYEEEWHLELNGYKEKPIPFCVKGEATIPMVLIGQNNSIKFESVQPDCQTTLAVPMKNISNFQIRYKFNLEDCKFIQVQPTNGHIFSNDEVYLQFSYTGNMCAPKECFLKYGLQAIQKIEELIGKPFSQTVTILSKCAFSELCAIPNQYNFGNVQWGTSLGTEFHLFNFGESVINFRLNVASRFGDDVFNIDPQYGRVTPGEKIKIHLLGVAKTVGDYVVEISYANRVSCSSKQTIQGVVEVFEIRYHCSFPTIQIEDIVEHTFGPLFGKEHFWKSLRIERFNDYLKHISNGETKLLHVYLPEFEATNEEFYVTLLVKNISHLEMNVDLKRKKLCDCPLIEEPGHMHIRKRIYDCLHREMLTMELSDSILHQNTETFLTIQVKYLLPEKTLMMYVLDLGDDRKIEIVFLIYTIPDKVLRISSYKSEYTMNLREVPVFRKVAPIQTYWLYNNTNKPAPFKMDTRELLSLCQKDGFEVMKCINPEGIIQPYSSTPLMIKFHPIEMKIYKVEVPLILGDTTCLFSIIGTGRAKEMAKPFSSSLMPAISKRSYNSPVNLSVDVLEFSLLPVWSTVEKIVFLRNLSKDKVIQYFWEECDIKGVVEVTTTPKSGVIRPKEFETILIKVKSFNEACISQLLLPCKLIDRVQLFLHKKSLELHQERQKEIEAEFIITEKGTSYGQNEIIVVDEPKPLIITIGINVNIIHTKDRDKCLNLEEQFCATPQDDMNINVANIIDEWIHCSKEREMTKMEIDKTKISNILEELIADFVFSKSFMELLKTSHTHEPPLYSQFVMDDRVLQEQISEPLSEDALMKLREEEIKQLFTQPKLTMVSETLKELILDSIHETFKLGAMAASQKDIDKEIENELQICNPQCDRH